MDITVRIADDVALPQGVQETRDPNNGNKLATMTEAQYTEMLQTNNLTEAPIFATIKLEKNGDMVGWIENAAPDFISKRLK